MIGINTSMDEYPKALRLCLDIPTSDAIDQSNEGTGRRRSSVGKPANSSNRTEQDILTTKSCFSRREL